MVIEKVSDLFISDHPQVKGRWGFFESLVKCISEQRYTTAQGNPIEVWWDRDTTTTPPTYRGIYDTQLDDLYLMRSGEKKLLSYVIKGAESYFEYAGDYNIFTWKLVETITRKYSRKWISLWNTMYYEYNPIENYNMVETLDDVSTLQHGKTETVTLQNVTRTRTGSEVDTPAVTTTNTEQIYGFDATNAQNANKSTITNTGTNTHAYQNVQDVDSGSTLTTDGGSDTNHHEYELTRSGNIGVTTSQQMITQERELLMFNYFDEIVFPDIDKVITLQVY